MMRRTEVRILARLGRREILVLLAAESRTQWPTSREELARDTALEPRQVLLALRNLEREGLLSRDYVGNRHDGAGKFRLQVTWPRLDPQDPTGSIPTIQPVRSPGSNHLDPHDPTGSIARIQPLLPGSSVTQVTRSVRPDLDPSRGHTRARETPDGRTDGEGTPVAEPDPAVARCVREHWPSLPRPAVAEALGRIAGAAASADELVGYLRAVARHLTDPGRYPDPAFDGLGLATFPFGAACTLDRFVPWVERRRNATRPVAERAPRSELRPSDSAAELAELEAARERGAALILGKPARTL